MASIRKRLSMALGLNGEASTPTSTATNIDAKRGSIDSGYHSMIAEPKRGSQGGLGQATTFINPGTESSPERSPRKLHKAISTTFSGAMQAFSNTVRSTTSYIYPTAAEPELPSRRSSISRGSQLLAGIKLPAAAGKLWPGPTRITVDQALGKDRRESLHPISSTFDDPYIEQGDVLQHGLSFVTSASNFALESLSPETSKRYLSDDKGYFSEVESNADVSDSDGLAPACLKYVALGSPEARTSSPCRHKDPAASHVQVASSASTCQRVNPSQMSSSMPLGPKPSKSETLDGTAEHTALLHPPSRTSSHHCASLEEGFDALLPPHEDTMTSKSRSLYQRLSPDVYDADAESLKSSMGSRAAWERHRVDRERRYMEIIDMAPTTESDGEVGPELELKRSPSKKPVHYAEELVLGTVNNGGSDSIPGYPPGALRYAVEAIERPAFPVGDLAYAVEAIERPAFPVGDLAYAVEAIERPSVTTFDPLETVFQQRPMLRLSDSIDEQETLRVSDPQALSPLRMEVPSSLPADLSPSQVDLPSSPESSPVDIPAAPKYTMMTMRFTDEELISFGPGNLDSQSIRQFSSESTNVSATSSPEQQSRAAPGDAYEAGLKAGGLFVPTYLSRSSQTRAVGEDAYEAALRAAGIFMPAYPSDVVQARPSIDNLYEGDVKAAPLSTPISKDTSNSTHREQLEAGSILLKPRSRNGTPFEHSRTVSAFSDDTDDSCAITTHSPSCNAPSPFPSLHVRPEAARRIPSAIDALATYGDEEIRITGPTNSGINPSLPSPFDGPGDQANEAGSKSSALKTLEDANPPDEYDQMRFPEQHDLQSPSTDTTSSIQSPSNTNTPQESFDAAKLPTFVSPSLIASRKARRKQKKNSSGMGPVPIADLPMNPRNVVLEPDFSPTKRELNKNSALGKTQTSLGESARNTRGSIQKPSFNRQSLWKNRPGRDQASFEELTEVVGGNVRWLDPASKSNSSKKSPGGKGQAAAALPVTYSPPRMRIPRLRGKASSGEFYEDAKSAVNDSKSRFEPELSIKNVDSISDFPPLYTNRRSGSTSNAGYELDRVLQASPSVHSRHELDADLQQDKDKKVVDLASGDATLGSDGESDKDVPRAPDHKNTDKPAPEVEKKFAVQRELERKLDRACSRLVGKVKSGAPGDGHVCEDDSAHKEGRPPWRP